MRKSPAVPTQQGSSWQKLRLPAELQVPVRCEAESVSREISALVRVVPLVVGVYHRRRSPCCGNTVVVFLDHMPLLSRIWLGHEANNLIEPLV